MVRNRDLRTGRHLLHVTFLLVVATTGMAQIAPGRQAERGGRRVGKEGRKRRIVSPVNLLAYHYLVAGYNDETIAELKEALRMEPSDQISANLLAMLGGSSNAKSSSSSAPTSAEPSPAPAEDAPIVQLDPEKLFGTWTAQRKGNPPIVLTLNQGQQFTWTVGQGDSQRVMKGEFSLGGDNLALQPEGNNAMVGTVSKVSAQGFNFRVVGAPPGDQGLDFTRK